MLVYFFLLLPAILMLAVGISFKYGVGAESPDTNLLVDTGVPQGRKNE